MRASSMDETINGAASGVNGTATANGAGSMVVDDEDEDANEAADLLMQMDNRSAATGHSSSSSSKPHNLSLIHI